MKKGNNGNIYRGNDRRAQPQNRRLSPQRQGNIPPERLAYEEEIRRKMRARRRQAERRRVRRNRRIALVVLILLICLIGVLIKGCSKSDKKDITDSNFEEFYESSQTTTQTESSVTESTVDDTPAVQTEAPDETGVNDESDETVEPTHDIQVIDGATYVDGILIVNKTYSLPSDYAPGVVPEAQSAFDEMAAAAAQEGIKLYVYSGYRSYWRQQTIYNNYAAQRGQAEADRVSSRPGHSEHQTGLTFDVNTTEFSFGSTPEAAWLAEHCAEYGFIIRYPEDKEDVTGYEYEPWHIRYLGVETAQAVKASGLCLEEYLGVTSCYEDAN